MRCSRVSVRLCLAPVLLAGLTVGEALAAYTARYETKDALSLSVYDGERLVASLTCRKPESLNGLLTLFIFLPQPPEGVTPPDDPSTVKGQTVPLPVEVTIHSALFGPETFKADRVQLQFDEGFRLAGDLSNQQVDVFAALIGAARIEIAVDGKPLGVDVEPGDIDVVVNGCGELREAAEKAGGVGPP